VQTSAHVLHYFHRVPGRLTVSFARSSPHRSPRAEFVFYMKLRNAHWSIHSPQFRELHKLFERLYEHADGVYDELAERVRVLGERRVRVPAVALAFRSPSTLSTGACRPPATPPQAAARPSCQARWRMASHSRPSAATWSARRRRRSSSPSRVSAEQRRRSGGCGRRRSHQAARVMRVARRLM
jgi:hypothetical protein